MALVKPTLPQRSPCDEIDASWSASIALLDSLIAALRAWQPRELPPAPATEQDIATLAALRPVSPSPTEGAAAANQR